MTQYKKSKANVKRWSLRACGYGQLLTHNYGPPKRHWRELSFESQIKFGVGGGGSMKELWPLEENK